MLQGKILLETCRALSDAALLAELRSSAVSERLEVIKTLARLAELNRRDLAREIGHSSLFLFCVKELGYCEATAYFRTQAAEACSKYPKILDLIGSGEITLTNAAVLSKHLTADNVESLLEAAKGKSRRQLEAILTGMDHSMPDLELYEHRFVFGEEAEAKLIRAKEVLSHKFPKGDLESILAFALDVVLEKMDPVRRRPAAGASPAPRAAEKETRRVPEWVRRIVRQRDHDRCSFVSSEGVRCEERRLVQFDHIKPWSLGGKSDDPKNIRQLCGAHNRWLARKMGLGRA